MEIYSIKSVGTFIVSKQLQREIDFLHDKIGAKEWSGVLFYSVENTEIASMKDLSFIGHHIFPMDIGTSGGTEFNYGPELMEIYDHIPEAMEMNMGLCHSHHNMSAFVSKTDEDELVKNAPSYNFYISLIVAFNRKYVCKIAFPTTCATKREFSLKDFNGEIQKVGNTEEKEMLILADLDIEFEGEENVDEWFSERYKVVEEENKKKVVTPIKTYPAISGKSYNEGDNYYKRKTEYETEEYNDSKYDKDLRFALSLAVGKTIFSIDLTNKTPREILKSLSKFGKDTELFNEEDIFIFHDNIYGTYDYNEMNHLKSAITKLNVYKSEFPILKGLIKSLNGYIDYAKTLADCR
jgi:hypothetical protein